MVVSGALAGCAGRPFVERNEKLALSGDRVREIAPLELEALSEEEPDQGQGVRPADERAALERQAAADVAVREVRHRLEHPNLYRAHGMSLTEGLWRNE